MSKEKILLKEIQRIETKFNSLTEYKDKVNFYYSQEVAGDIIFLGNHRFIQRNGITNIQPLVDMFVKFKKQIRPPNNNEIEIFCSERINSFRQYWEERTYEVKKEYFIKGIRKFTRVRDIEICFEGEIKDIHSKIGKEVDFSKDLVDPVTWNPHFDLTEEQLYYWGFCVSICKMDIIGNIYEIDDNLFIKVLEGYELGKYYEFLDNSFKALKYEKSITPEHLSKKIIENFHDFMKGEHCKPLATKKTKFFQLVDEGFEKLKKWFENSIEHNVDPDFFQKEISSVKQLLFNTSDKPENYYYQTANNWDKFFNYAWNLSEPAYRFTVNAFYLNYMNFIRDVDNIYTETGGTNYDFIPCLPPHFVQAYVSQPISNKRRY